MRLTRWMTVVVVAGLFAFGGLTGTVAAATASPNIATINIQDVLTKSVAGLEAKKVMEAEVVKFQSGLQQEKEDLDALQEELEKKSSVWSDETRQEKESVYQKKLSKFKYQSEEAQYELQQMEKKLMDPILKELKEVIAAVSKEKGYSLVMDSRAGLLYVDESFDISELIQQKLDARLTAKK